MGSKTLTILGSTGSIGRSTLDIAQRFPGEFRVRALAAHSNIELLSEQIEQFRPDAVVVFDPERALQLRERKPARGRTTVLAGMEGLLDISTDPKVDQVVAGMMGAIGLKPTYAAVEAGKQVALANKEVLVLAGDLVTQRARDTGALLLPVDSEHNAIFQCLAGSQRSEVRRILLTGSGGPFRELEMERFAEITLEQALTHPNWKMGPKITIDSATMMNKGLEVIEACRVFDVRPDQIEVVIHRQSIVHSMVEFVDGSVLAQLGVPDMRIPIAYCLAYPRRLALDLPRLSLTQAGRLDFEEVPENRYPCLFLALRALRKGGGAPAALNGANEAVVAAYLRHAFAFNQIAGILKEVMTALDESLQKGDTPCLGTVRTVEDALAADAWGRSAAAACIERVGRSCS